MIRIAITTAAFVVGSCLIADSYMAPVSRQIADSYGTAVSRQIARSCRPPDSS